MTHSTLKQAITDKRVTVVQSWWTRDSADSVWQRAERRSIVTGIELANYNGGTPGDVTIVHDLRFITEHFDVSPVTSIRLDDYRLAKEDGERLHGTELFTRSLREFGPRGHRLHLEVIPA